MSMFYEPESLEHRCPCCDADVMLDRSEEQKALYLGQCWNCDAELSYNALGDLDLVKVVKRGVA